jgi:hypothetical protein
MAKIHTSTAPATDGRISRRPVEVGASGTENYGGYLSGLDYNSQLAPPNGFRIYDEMRRSDPQVRASLEIIKLPLLSAAWSIQPPDQATPQEQELTDLCKAVVLDQGAMTETWDYVLRHALLMLDFGCSTLEKVYVLKATPFGEKVGLDRLAPRLPWTIEKFHVDERQKLTFIEQRALKADGKGGGTTTNLMIPADRVAHLVHRREGDNYFGESILRSAYKPWVFKFAAEKADAVRVYRQVAGVPMASYDMEVAQKASAQTPDKDEIARVESMLRGMATSKLEFLRTSTLWKWSWMHGSSDGKSADVEKTIERHDRAILRNVLGDFMAGAADGLNSGKTRTLTDFFGAALYAIAHLIEDELSLHVLRPLCALNFPTEGLRFPRLQADDVTDIDVAQIAETLGKLGINYVQPDDTLEEALRKLVGLPPRDAATTRKPPTPPPFGMPGAPPAKAPAGDDPDDKDDPDAVPAVDRAPKKGAKDAEETSAELRALRAQKGSVFGGRVYGREPRPFELYAFNVAEVPDTLDATTADLRAQLEAIRRKQLNVLATKLSRGDELTAGRPDDIVVPFKKDVEAAFKRALTTIYQYGRTQVQLELAKQGRDIRLVAASSLVLAGAAGKNQRTAKSALTTSAKVATEKETDYWVNRIIETAARLRRNGLDGPGLASRIQEALSADVEQAVLPLAKSEVNEGFAIGRQAEATAQQDEIDHVEYSALLDANTCEACAALDGKTFAFGSEEYHETLPPYQGCEGNKGQPDACRCVHLYHAKG